MIDNRLTALLADKFLKGDSAVSGRLQAAIALLERLRDFPELELAAHLTRSGQSLTSHETYGNRALDRLKVVGGNKNHGRRSSNLQDWGQDLLDVIKAEGFPQASSGRRSEVIDAVQSALAGELRRLIETDPITLPRKKCVASVLFEKALEQAEGKGYAAAVAQYLVGAKLRLRLPELRAKLPVTGANKGDRSGRLDTDPRRGDFDLGDFVIEVTIGPPDQKHLEQVESIIESSDAEVWLLVRRDRLEFWLNEAARRGVDFGRCAIVSLEQFLGQNVSEMGSLTFKGKQHTLAELFKEYNEEWVAKVGTPGMRIVFS